ncbi:hypothetical protein, partial [Bartonella tribocorum]|uniref:hypothetical protein n=1 Tax=Bartonella tribocorum TaxID=85701 RepID=UPI001ABBB096
RLLCVFRESKTLSSVSFLLLVLERTWTWQNLPEFRDIYKADQCLCLAFQGFKIPHETALDNQNHALIHKTISREQQ